ncbi:hypothetical protein B0H21DRAFT_582377 [Amylocystis lapponica]|nr:hypothetical protein B0H21DRAFT_582377 [Amylocystis lapponica]
MEDYGNSITFRAVLRRDGELISSVVCKFAYGKHNLKRLRHEATIYRERLKELGGRVVPNFYGLYEGEMEDEELTGCLVTQYCGEHAGVPFYGLSLEKKVLLVGAVARLHDDGVRHGDFRESNVVFTPDGIPCIIDFDCAEVHTCESTMPIVFHRPQPDPEEFGCDELFSACNSTGAWTPCHIKYLHVYRPIEYVESAEKLASLAPENVDRELALEIAERLIYEHWEGMRKRLACDWN